MFTLVNARRQLAAVEALADRYQQLLPYLRPLNFLDSIQVVKDNLDLIQNDMMLPENTSTDLEILLRNLELKIINSLIERLDAELEMSSVRDPKGIKKYIAMLRTVEKSLIGVDIKPIPIKEVITFINDCNLLTSTPLATISPSFADSVLVHKKNKRTKVVEITDSSLAINLQRLNLSAQLTDKEGRFKALQKVFIETSNSQESEPDPLIVLKLKELKPLYVALAKFKKESVDVSTKMEIIRLLNIGLFAPDKFNDLNVEEKVQIADALNFLNQFAEISRGTLEKISKKFIPVPIVNAEKLTALDVKRVKDMAIELAHRADATPSKMEKKLLECDKQYLDALEQHLALMTEATQLIMSIINELDEIKRSAVVSEEPSGDTTVALSDGLTVVGLRLKLSGLLAEVDTLIDQINRNVASVPKADVMVTELLALHTFIYLEVDMSEKERHQRVQVVRSPDALSKYPLESDRLVVENGVIQQHIEHLQSIKKRLETNSKRIHEAISLRDSTAISNRYVLGRKADLALENIQKMKGISRHSDFQNVDMDRAVDNMQLVIDEIKKSPSTFISTDVDTLKETYRVIENKITSIMAPLLDSLKTYNERFMHNITAAQNALQLLREAIEPTIINTSEQSVICEQIANELEALTIGQHTIFDANYSKLEAAQSKIDNENANVQLLKQTTIDSPTAKAIFDMISSVEVEISTIKGTNNNPRILSILGGINTDLQAIYDSYVTLKIDNKTVIDEVITSMQRNLSQEKLENLSAEVLNPFILFIRNLLKPVMKVIKDVMGDNSWQPGFFASPIEANLTVATRRAHGALNQIKNDGPDMPALGEPRPIR